MSCIVTFVLSYVTMAAVRRTTISTLSTPGSFRRAELAPSAVLAHIQPGTVSSTTLISAAMEVTAMARRTRVAAAKKPLKFLTPPSF